jgi:hypothetical protein
VSKVNRRAEWDCWGVVWSQCATDSIKVYPTKEQARKARTAFNANMRAEGECVRASVCRVRVTLVNNR